MSRVVNKHQRKKYHHNLTALTVYFSFFLLLRVFEAFVFFLYFSFIINAISKVPYTKCVCVYRPV